VRFAALYPRPALARNQALPLLDVLKYSSLQQAAMLRHHLVSKSPAYDTLEKHVSDLGRTALPDFIAIFIKKQTSA